MELKITKEKVLEAASKCSTAKETLEMLFPDVFDVGVTLKRYDVKSGGYNDSVIAVNEENVGVIWFSHAEPSGQYLNLSDRYTWEIIERENKIGYKLTPTKKP